jgi:hypothetical protein
MTMILDLLGLSLQQKMVIRLYLPMMLLIAAAFVTSVVGDIFYDRFMASKILSGLGEMIANGVNWLSILLLCLSVLFCSYATFRLWKWDKNEDSEICHVCGGITTVKNGRFGEYLKCFACGNALLK